MRIVYDTESNGFVDTATKLWCLCLKTEDGRTLTYHDSGLYPRDGTIREGLELLGTATEIVCHNQISHDLPLLEKLYNWKPNENTTITDTLVLSFLYNPDRKVPAAAPSSCGPHSIEGWGYRVGRGKVDHEDWTVLSADMLRRCREDVEINESIYYILQAEAKGTNWTHAIRIESEVRRIIDKQEKVGVRFHVTKAIKYISQLEKKIQDLDDELLPNLPKRPVVKGVPIREPYLKTGGLRKMVTDFYTTEEEQNNVKGPFSRLIWEPMNLGSMSQVKDYLLNKAGWIPTEWNYKDGVRTSPKLTEDSFESIRGSIGQAIKNRYLWSHRKNQIQGWINRLRPDGRLSAAAITCGTNTRRFRHINVVNVPKAKDYVFFGREMRSLFIASRGRKLVGHDAAGLELRMLAHYMKDDAFTEAVINGREEDGTDIHTLNQRLAGLPDRDSAKTFIYAFLYGAGDAKIGRIIGGTATDGAALKRRFLRNLPSLARLIKRVKQASRKGWLKGIDGSRIVMRRNEQGEIMQHKALNTLLQSAGAIIMKESMVILDEQVRLYVPRVNKVLDMHDEAQAEVLPSDLEKYIELAENSIVQAGKNFDLRCPLAATAKVGRNWAETH